MDPAQWPVKESEKQRSQDRPATVPHLPGHGSGHGLPVLLRCPRSCRGDRKAEGNKLSVSAELAGSQMAQSVWRTGSQDGADQSSLQIGTTPDLIPRRQSRANAISSIGQRHSEYEKIATHRECANALSFKYAG